MYQEQHEAYHEQEYESTNDRESHAVLQVLAALMNTSAGDCGDQHSPMHVHPQGNLHVQIDFLAPSYVTRVAEHHSYRLCVNCRVAQLTADCSVSFVKVARAGSTVDMGPPLGRETYDRDAVSLDYFLGTTGKFAGAVTLDAVQEVVSYDCTTGICPGGHRHMADD